LLKETALDELVSPRTVLSRIDRAKNRNVDPRSIKTGIYDDVIERIYPMYQAQLAKENAVDFNDLLLKVLELLARDDTAARIKRKLQFVLVDEDDPRRGQRDHPQEPRPPREVAVDRAGRRRSDRDLPGARRALRGVL